MALSSEAFDNAFYDPLTINLAKQMRALVAFSSTQSAGASSPLLSLLSSLSTSMTTTKESLGVLSRCLAEPSLTNIVADLFRPLLIDLCARWLGRGSDEEEENKFIAFCLLIENHEELFPVLYAFLRQPHLDRGPLAFVEGDLLSIPALDITRLQRLLLAYYRLLRANRLLPSELLWPAFALSALFASQTPHLDPAVKYLAIRCYALHTGMAEVDRLKFEREVFGEEVEKGKKEFDMVYDLSGSGKEEVVDARVMPVLEMKRIHEVRSAMMMPHDFHALEEGDVSQCISESDLSPWVVNIHGVLMLKSSPTPLPRPKSSSPLPPYAPCDQIVTVHLADTSLDPRSLLGSYVSSPTRLGTFEWKDCVVKGKWLVFEDIDKGSMEVLGLIKALAESMGPGKWNWRTGTYCGAEPEKVYAAEGFAVSRRDRFLLVVEPLNGTKIPEPTFYGRRQQVKFPGNCPARLFEGRSCGCGWQSWEWERLYLCPLDEGVGEVFYAGAGFGASLDTAMEVDSGADEDEGGDGEGIILPSIFPISRSGKRCIWKREMYFLGVLWLNTLDWTRIDGSGFYRLWPTFGVEKDVNGDTTDVHVGRALPARAEKRRCL
ncbi:hypothetical protein EDD16DRAFT_1732044 [Pisolithus croceorrhizus]|nr:hypothetical protein EDD16DRAFT_1732044 [Pisolithus croceorrhizus]